jgi:hypothetical protein
MRAKRVTTGALEVIMDGPRRPLQAARETPFLIRDSILKLLSDNEIASVSTGEAGTRLLANDEYIDLEHLDQGVCRALGGAIPMGTLLAKKAVGTRTWTKIMKELVTPLPPA